MHVLRLHFFPFSSPTQNLFSAKFKVFYGDLLLLENSGFPPGVAVNEFFIRATGGKASISFQATSPSVVFISAVEFFSAPAALLQANGNWKGLSDQISLQTLHRINMGGPLITPLNDTLWRKWIPDDEFLLDARVSKPANTSGTINYAGNGALSPEIAPPRVYNTLRQMNSLEDDPQIHIAGNIWLYLGIDIPNNNLIYLTLLSLSNPLPVADVGIGYRYRNPIPTPRN